MVVAEMRPTDVPVEILGLEIKRKGVGQDAVEGTGDVLGGIGAQISGSGKARRGAAGSGVIHGGCPSDYPAKRPGPVESSTHLQL